MEEGEPLRWNTNSQNLQPNHEAVSREVRSLSVNITFSLSCYLLSLSASVFGRSVRLAMRKLPMNETTVDIKEDFFYFFFYPCSNVRVVDYEIL